jgi:hypothetical protein
MTEEQRIAFGLRPRTLRGCWFWLIYWSPPALWLLKRLERQRQVDRVRARLTQTPTYRTQVQLESDGRVVHARSHVRLALGDIVGSTHDGTLIPLSARQAERMIGVVVGQENEPRP